MGISEVVPGGDISDSNNEKGELQYVENTVTVSPLTERIEDGKLTKETILAYIVRHHLNLLLPEYAAEFAPVVGDVWPNQ